MKPQIIVETPTLLKLNLTDDPPPL
jgi:hypothetical protein